MYCLLADFGVDDSLLVVDFTFETTKELFWIDLFVDVRRDYLIKGRTYCFKVLVNLV